MTCSTVRIHLRHALRLLRRLERIPMDRDEGKEQLSFRRGSGGDSNPFLVASDWKCHRGPKTRVVRAIIWSQPVPTGDSYGIQYESSAAALYSLRSSLRSSWFHG